ncbi:esterase/lipase family protein [Variovorax boronicumulans]|uniref:esterase/lipase family protein n=1 Tax=Variovorax boronicumulans TaxID=436515 RepID=UPI00339B0104
MAVQGEDEDAWLDFSLGIGGFADVAVVTTPTADKRKVHVRVPPGKLIPIVFLPGIMGSNLRLSNTRQTQINRDNNISWWPDKTGDAWNRRNASAAERQMRLDPDEVEVDRYKVTDNGSNLFDATGDETVNSDKRHNNVPDDLGNISKLLVSDPKADPHHPLASNRQSFTAAQKARARGWSEVMFGSYGDIIQCMERQLNDMLQGQGEAVNVSKSWSDQGRREALVGREPSSFGGASGDPLTEDDLKKIGDCWYPVHAFGYNWLKSNGDEAKSLAPKIDKLVETYSENGFNCPGVILVTHSMGGILARALIHPDYGNIKSKVLGIVHGVMPTTGAAAAYKRIRAGFEGGKGFWDVKGNITQKVLGENGEKVTAVLANAQGGLELLPATAYGTQWLQVQDQHGKVLARLPDANALDEIYTLAPNKWWRLINPAWIDPAGQAEMPKDRGGKTEIQIGTEATMRRVINAMKFADAIQDTFHDCTYAHYGNDPDQPAWNDVVWRVVNGDATAAGNPLTWTPLGDDGTGTLRVRGAHGAELQLRLQPPDTAADGTVPVQRSADKVQARIKFSQTGYDHQGSYMNQGATAATLYSIVRIANAYDSAWWAKKDWDYPSKK